MNSTFYKALTVDELKAYGHDNNLKLPQACKKQELIETILNRRYLGLIKSAGDPTASIAIPHHARTSSVRECIYNINSLGFLHMNRSSLVGMKDT